MPGLSDADVGLGAAPAAGFSDADVGLTNAPAGLSDTDVGLAAPPPQGYLKATANAAGQAAVKGVGNALEGVGAVAETMPLTGVSFYNPPVWARPETDPTAQAQTQRTALLGKPAELLQTIRQDPIYQAGASLAEAAPKLMPVAPERATQFGPRAAAMAGSFVPLLASGPAAPATIGLQAIGAHLNDDFEQGKAQGLSDDAAAARTLSQATASGALQSTVFLALPAPLRAAGEKWILGKFGDSVLQRFLAGRVALGAEGAVLGGASAGAENVATGQPLTKNMGASALGLGLAGAVMPPYLPEKQGTPAVGPPRAASEQVPENGEQVAPGRGQTPSQPTQNGTVVPKAAPPQDVAPDVLTDLQRTLTANQVPPKAAPEAQTGTIVPEATPDTAQTGSTAPGSPAGFTNDFLDEVWDHGNAGLPMPERADVEGQLNRNLTDKEWTALVNFHDGAADAGEATPPGTGEPNGKPRALQAPVEAPQAPESAEQSAPAEIAQPAAEIPDKVIQRDMRAEADPVLDYLNSLKVDTNGAVHAFGLLPEAWNRLVDGVILAVRGGRAIRDAVSAAFDRFKKENPGVEFDEAGARAHFENTPLGNLRYESPEAGGASQATHGASEPEISAPSPAAPAADAGYENLKRVAAEKSDALQAVRQEIAGARERSQPVTQDMLQRQRAAKQQDQAARKALNNHPGRAQELIKESVAAARELEAARQSGDAERMANANTRFELARGAEETIPAGLHQRVYDDLVKRGELPAMKAFPGFEGQRGGPRFADPLPRPEESQAPFKRFFGLETAQFPRVRDMLDGLSLARQRLAAWWAKRPVAGQMTYLWDGAMNWSRGVARQTSNIVLHELNREFGESNVERRNGVREAALSFATEADGDISKLQEMREKILASGFAQKKTGRQALAAIDYAENFWDRFNTPNDRRSGLSLVELQQELTAMERGTELNSGLDVPEWQSPYIMHATVPEESGVLVKQQQGGGITEKFTRKRMNPTLADDVAEGVPLRSLSAIDLLEQRVRYGQENVNAISWMHTLRQIHDPTTKQPLVTDVIPRTRADGSHYDDAPPGYSVVNVGRVKFSMLNGYDGVFGDLTDPSWFSKGSLRRGTQQAFGLLKHLVTLGDTMHLGVEATRKFLLTGNFGYSKGLTLIDNTPREIQLMADRGEIPKQWTGDLLNDKRKLDLLVKQGANLQDLSSNLHQHWVEKVPLGGTFNKWLFSRYVRGAMAEAALMKFDQVARPGEPEAVTARRVAKDINDIFGNIANQGWMRSKTGQDLMRAVMFAPYWNETLLRTEAGGVGQLLGDVKRTISGQPALNAKAQVILAGTAGLFVANQIINMATRGKPTWENPEEGFGSKISAYIPDVIGHGPGFFLNPFSLSMKLTHLAASKLERNWEEAQPKNIGEAAGTLARAGAEVLQSRLTQPLRAAMVPVTRRDAFGRPLRNEDLWPEMARTLTPLPISAPAALQAAKQLATGQHSEAYRGQFQRQIFSSGGVLLDQAPTPGLRISRLASAFNAKLGKAPDTAGEPHGDFQQLDNAIERGNDDDTKSALRDLLDRRTAAQIVQHYQRWANQPFTGSLQREAQFRQSLNPEQMQQYAIARETRTKLRRVVSQLLPQAIAEVAK